MVTDCGMDAVMSGKIIVSCIYRVVGQSCKD